MKRTTQLGIVLLIVAVAAVGIVSAFTDRSVDRSGTPEDGPIPTSDTYDPFADGIETTRQQPDQAAAPLETTPPADMDRSMESPEPVGDPVADGQEVSLVIPYRAGTKSRYRISTLTRTQDRRTKAAGARRVIYDTAIEVTKGDGSGPAVIRLANEAFDISAITGADPAGNSIGWRFDSRDPDERLLKSRPEIEANLKAELVNLDQPLAFTIGAHGGPESVDGVKGWRDRFLTELERVNPKFVTEAPHTPEPELLEDTWGMHLFPRLGGKTLEGGKTRKLLIREDTFYKGYVVHELDARVTHANEDVFTVEAVGKPGWLPRMGAARGTAEGGVHKGHVQASANSSRFMWVVDRKAGRLLAGYYSVKFQLWISWRQGKDDFGQLFTDLERIERVELLPEEAPDEPESTDEEAEEASAAPTNGTESAKAGDDPGK